MLEAVLETQLEKLEKPPISEEDQKTLISKTKQVKHALSSVGYKHEEQFN